MRGDDHHEAAIAVDVVKDLAPPHGRAVPYLTMRAFIVGGQQQRVDDESRGTGLGLGRWSRGGARVRDRPLVGLPAGLRRAGGPHRRFPERSGSRWSWGSRGADRESTTTSFIRRLEEFDPCEPPRSASTPVAATCFRGAAGRATSAASSRAPVEMREGFRRASHGARPPNGRCQLRT